MPEPQITTLLQTLTDLEDHAHQVLALAKAVPIRIKAPYPSPPLYGSPGNERISYREQIDAYVLERDVQHEAALRKVLDLWMTLYPDSPLRDLKVPLKDLQHRP